MSETIPKSQYLQRVLELSDAMIAALEAGDVDMAGAVYDERVRFIETMRADDEPVEPDVIERVLARDQAVIAAALKRRHDMVGSAAQLNAVSRYSSQLPGSADGGDWGSG